MKNNIEYPITLKRAKEIAKNKLGRLPRPGYEVRVAYLPVKEQLYPNDYAYAVYLANYGGKFSLWQWYNVNYHEIGYDMSKVVEG